MLCIRKFPLFQHLPAYLLLISKINATEQRDKKKKTRIHKLTDWGIKERKKAENNK